MGLAYFAPPHRYRALHLGQASEQGQPITERVRKLMPQHFNANGSGAGSHAFIE